MITWLRHPEHGVKPAYSAPEIKDDKEHGWEEFTPEWSEAYPKSETEPKAPSKPRRRRSKKAPSK